jgi:ribosomal protein eS8
LGRQAANTKLGPKRVHEVRVRGGNKKYRALRLDAGNFSWGSENCTRKTRVLTVVYNASNNELVRTNTLVKGAVIQVDATPFRQWYEAHYAQTLGKKKGTKAAETEATAEKKSNHVQRKLASRKADAKVDSLVEDQFTAGRLYGKPWPPSHPCFYVVFYTLAKFLSSSSQDLFPPWSIWPLRRLHLGRTRTRVLRPQAQGSQVNTYFNCTVESFKNKNKKYPTTSELLICSDYIVIIYTILGKSLPNLGFLIN